MFHFEQLRRSIRQHRTAALEQELIAACSRPLLTPGRPSGLPSELRSGLRSGLPSSAHSPLDAAEGLFLASILATFFWSALFLVLAYLR